jgi:hypothetical protein
MIPQLGFRFAWGLAVAFALGLAHTGTAQPEERPPVPGAADEYQDPRLVKTRAELAIV